jgi:hypothetical protein
MKKLTDSQTGDAGEAGFLYEAIMRGFVVYKPFGSAEGADFIVDTGSKLLKVQVKAANWTVDRGSHGLKFYISDKLSKVATISKKFDVLVCYDIQNRDFYILTAKQVRVKNLSFSSKKNSYPCKNNWAPFQSK